MLQNKKKIQSIITTVIVLLSFVNTHFITDDISYNAFALLSFFKEIQYKMITMPELYLAIIILFLSNIFLDIYEFICKKKSTDKHIPAEGRKYKFILSLNIIIYCITSLFIILSSVTLITKKSNDIPEFSDGIYLDVHDFGIADKITGTGYSISDEYYPNKITHRKTLSAEIHLTDEHYDINEKNVIIYQDVITYKSQKTALYAAELLVNEYHTEYQADRFDKVYKSAGECIAVINNTVYRIHIFSTDENIEITTDQLLDAILKKQV